MKDNAKQLLSKLKRGDLIEIIWLDASEQKGAPLDIDLDKVTPTFFATYKKNVGWFIGVATEALYKQNFLIFYDELTDEKRGRIVSIPLSSVMNIERFEKAPIKEVSTIGVPILQGKKVKVVYK